MYLALKYQARRFFRQGNLLFQMANVFSVITVRSPDNLELKRRSAGSSRASSLLNGFISTSLNGKALSPARRKRLCCSMRGLKSDWFQILESFAEPCQSRSRAQMRCWSLATTRGVDAVTHLPREEAVLVGITGTLR